jgi:N,N'-diacetyllegionaminate synthase
MQAPMIADDSIPFRVGPATIERSGRAYVIAEAGVNHDGDASVARRLVDAAAGAGADAVKFQVFSAERLVTRSAPPAAYQQAATNVCSQYDMLARLQLSQEQFADLAQHAAERRIEFLATPFSPEDLGFLCRLGVRAIKLASPDIVNVPLLGAAAVAGVPVIASTGAAELDEIAAAVELFRGAGTQFALLHCVSSYPARCAEANLGAIRTLAGTFGCMSGFSDHTRSLAAGGLAVAAGARIVEKHFTLDHTREGPDHRFSLEPGALALYIRNIRRVESMMGDGAIAMTAAQQDVRQIARSSVVAARTIHAGQTLTRDMLAVKRPGGGIVPAELETLVGRRTRTTITKDTLVKWEAIV